MSAAARAQQAAAFQAKRRLAARLADAEAAAAKLAADERASAARCAAAEAAAGTARAEVAAGARRAADVLGCLDAERRRCANVCVSVFLIRRSHHPSQFCELSAGWGGCGGQDRDSPAGHVFVSVADAPPPALRPLETCWVCALAPKDSPALWCDACRSTACIGDGSLVGGLAQVPIAAPQTGRPMPRRGRRQRPSSWLTRRRLPGKPSAWQQRRRRIGGNGCGPQRSG